MKKIKGFTLIEVMISVSLFALIIVLAFDVMGNISISRVKLSNRLDINQDIYVAVESIVNNIKDFDWDIDYEEYWNRSSIGIWTTFGHYSDFSWLGNYWSWWNTVTNSYWDNFYFCRSWAWVGMWTWWCLNWYNDYWDSASFSWKYQRFWEYVFQFLDYNSNQNDDIAVCWAWFNLWDEDCDLRIRWDDDDENLWEWPVAFMGNEVKEIYLLRKWKVNERFLMRLNIKKDPLSPASYNCASDWTGSWCLGNIQILKLVGSDLWMSHSWAVTSSGQYDWVIDTWKCWQDYKCSGDDDMPNSIDDWWIDLLPSYINVKKFRVFVYPNINYKYSWRSLDDETTLNPYIRINMDLGYSWERRKKLNWTNPTISITTSINLTKN